MIRRLLIVSALVAAVPATASAAPTWLPTRTLDPPFEDESITSDTEPVFDADGTMLVVVQRYDPGQASDINYVIARRPGQEATRTELSPDESGPSVVTTLDPRGGAAFTWIDGTDIKVRRRALDGTFGAIETIPSGVAEPLGARLAIGPDGSETFAFRSGYVKNADTGHSRVLAMRRAGPGQPFDPVQNITLNDLDSEDGRVGDVTIAAGPSGAAVIVYELQVTYPASFSPTLFARRRGAAQTVFGAQQTIAAAAEDTDRHELGIDAAGRATLAYTSSSGGRRARLRDAPADTGNFGAAVALSTAMGNPSHNYVFLDVSPNGSAAVGFGGGGTADQWVARRGPSPADPLVLPQAFEAAVRVDGGFTDPETPHVAIADDGAAYAVVRSDSITQSDLDGWRSAGPGQPWLRTRLVDNGATGDGGEYGIGSEGNAVVLYKGKDDQNDSQRALVAVPFDDEPPTVSLAGPGSLLTGVAGVFTPTAFDYWGPVTTTIAHDDGGAGSPHAYATAGDHVATATATDLAGYSAQAQAVTKVAAPPPAPPQPASPAPLPPPVPPAVVRRRPTAAQVISLPSSRRCVSRRRFRIRLRRPGGLRLTRAVVTINGRRAKTVRGRALSAPVDLRGLPKGRVRVSVTVTDSTGRRLTLRRSYRTCTPKRRARRSR